MAGNNFIKTHKTLADMMGRPGGAFDWSESHKSLFELSKLELMDFSPNAYEESTLMISHPHTNRSTTIKSVQSHRFLGVMFNHKLRWNVQNEHTTRLAETWINLVRRLAQTSTDLSARGI